MGDQLLHEFLGRSGGKCPIERQDKEMRDPEIPDQRDLVLGGGEQMRGILRAQDFRGMRIERHHHRRPCRSFGVTRRSGDDGLVTEVETVEGADGEEEGPGKSSEVCDGTQDVHGNDGENDEWRE